MESAPAPSNKRNIEIKARIANDAEFEKRVQIAKELTGGNGELLPQHDVFFNVTNGRLKLRYQQVRPMSIGFFGRKSFFCFFFFFSEFQIDVGAIQSSRR